LTIGTLSRQCRRWQREDRCSQINVERNLEMSIKKLGAVLVAALAIAALGASSASAAVETSPVQWYTGATAGTVATLTEDTAVTARSSGAATLTGILNGQAYELSTSTIECLNCKITNEEVTSTAGKVAIGKGEIKFSSVSVLKPSGCTVNGITSGGASEATGIVTTRPLTVHADWMDNEKKEEKTNKKGFINFFPTAGATTVFAGLQFVGASCPIAGKFNVTGTLYGESSNETGVMSKEQPVNFSAAIQSTTGASLKLGPTNVTTLTGTGIFETDEEKVGGGKKFFGVK